MTESTVRRPMIRPAFMKWSAVAFALLLPFVVHSIWQYVEDRRLDRMIHDIELGGEPIGPPETGPSGDEAEAERDYRAAAALASAFRVDTQPTLKGALAASQSDTWPVDVVTPLKAAIGIYEPALMLADRAGALPFSGFAPWTSYSYRTADLMNVQQLSGYRAIVRAVDGDGEGAVDSLYTAVRLCRAVKGYAPLRASDIVQVLERTRPSSSMLATLGMAFDELDDDRDLSRWFEEFRRTDVYNRRAQLGGFGPWQGLLATIVFGRPWSTHVLNGQLATLSSLIAASRESWPQRIDRVMAVDALDIFPAQSSVPGVAPKDRGRSALEGFVLGNVSRTAGFRAVRVAVAVEQYRREHAEQLPAALTELVPADLRAAPIDPFSGRAMLLNKESGGYSVYSVGTNRRDDGGKDANRPPVGAFPTQYPADIGVRVQYR